MRHLWLVNYGERNSTSPLLRWAILSLVVPVTFGHTTTACRSSVLALSAAAIHFAIKCSAPCSTVLRFFPSSWAAVVHGTGLMPKALRSFRKHPIYCFLCPPTQPAPPTNYPNITHFGGLVFYLLAFSRFPLRKPQKKILCQSESNSRLRQTSEHVKLTLKPLARTGFLSLLWP